MHQIRLNLFFTQFLTYFLELLTGGWMRAQTGLLKSSFPCFCVFRHELRISLRDLGASWLHLKSRESVTIKVTHTTMTWQIMIGFLTKTIKELSSPLITFLCYIITVPHTADTHVQYSPTWLWTAVCGTSCGSCTHTPCAAAFTQATVDWWDLPHNFTHRYTLQ